jgi:hypothetical protein
VWARKAKQQEDASTTGEINWTVFGADSSECYLTVVYTAIAWEPAAADAMVAGCQSKEF